MTTSGWKLKLVTPPRVEPVTLDEAKEHLRVTISDEDASITRFIQAAREAAESFTRRAFVTQTWEAGYSGFCSPTFEVPKPPLQSVVSIAYTDDDGAEHTLPDADYTIDDYSEPGVIYRARTASWPVLTEPGTRVRIRFVAGYRGDGSPGDGAKNVPAAVKQAILLHVGAMQENRQDAVAMPAACESLLHPLRVYGWGDA